MGVDRESSPPRGPDGSGGRLGDLLGLRRIFLLGSAVFAGASLVAGLAPTFEILVASRAVQGAGGALLLPTSVAIVSSVARGAAAGRALGTLGGASAVAGALGPIIGGSLAGAFGWRAVMLVNLPLAALSVVVALRVVPADAPRRAKTTVDLAGAGLLCVALVGIVFGVSQSQTWGWTSAGVLLPLVAAIAASVVFIAVERRVSSPLLDFGLLAKHRNYAGATLSQGLGGMIEMGLGVIFPLLLILNHGMHPTLAGLALLPTTLPMVIVAPLAGRWYDRVGGRIPLVTGFAILALSGLALMWAAYNHAFIALLPGLFLYGIGLAIVLTVNDPVSLDSVPDEHHGQVSGVSATAEQFGGALGIALFYLVFHSTYVGRLHYLVDTSSLPNLTDNEYAHLRDEIVAAEQTGLAASDLSSGLREYITIAFDASGLGYTVAFAGVVVVAGLGMFATARLVRRVHKPGSTDMSTAQKVFAAGASVGSGAPPAK